MPIHFPKFIPPPLYLAGFINPNAVVYFNRGSAKYQSGDYTGAIADFNQAIQLQADYAEAYNQRGLAKSMLGDKRRAIEDFIRQ